MADGSDRPGVELVLPGATHPGARPEVTTGSGSAAVGRNATYGKVAKRGVLWSFYREGVSEMITTPTAMILARLLTPFDFGIAASTGFFLLLAQRLTTLGFNQALVRVKDLRPDHSSTVFVISLVMGIGLYAGLYGASGLIGAFFDTPEVAAVIPVAAITFLITPFGSVPAALLTRNMRFQRSAAADWASGVTEATSTVTLALLGFGYWSIVYGHIAGISVDVMAKIVLARWRPSLRFSRLAARELASFGTGIMAKRLLDYTAKNVDNLVVGGTLGIVSLGFYDKAFVTMNKALSRLNKGGPIVSFRIFSLISDDSERFGRAYRKVMLGAGLITYPLMAGLAALGPELIVVMYGQRWVAAVLPFQILCASGVLKILNEYAGSAAQADGRIWDQVSRQTIYAVLIAAFVWTFSGAGLPGAAFGVLLATVSMTAMMTHLLRRASGISMANMFGPQVPGLLAGGSVAGAIVGLRLAVTTLAPAASPWQVLLATSLGGGLTFLLFLKFVPIREVRQFIRDLARDLGAPVGSIIRLLV